MKLVKQGCEALSLHVKSDNVSAIAFYRSLKFSITSFHDSFYEINGRLEDAYQMQLIIPPALRHSARAEDISAHYVGDALSRYEPPPDAQMVRYFSLISNLPFNG